MRNNRKRPRLMAFDFLFQPLTIRAATMANRIFSTGHQTRMVAQGLPSDDMVAYHRARAAGGAGLIIMEAARVHESALSDAPAIDASTDACIPAIAVSPRPCMAMAASCSVRSRIPAGSTIACAVAAVTCLIPPPRPRKTASTTCRAPCLSK